MTDSSEGWKQVLMSDDGQQWRQKQLHASNPLTIVKTGKRIKTLKYPSLFCWQVTLRDAEDAQFLQIFLVYANFEGRRRSTFFTDFTGLRQRWHLTGEDVETRKQWTVLGGVKGVGTSRLDTFYQYSATQLNVYLWADTENVKRYEHAFVNFSGLG